MKNASAFKRDDGWYFHADCKTTDGLWIESSPRIKHSVDATSSVLGQAVIEVLSGSKEGVPRPPLAELHEEFTPLMELAGVKTWAAFARRASSVVISADNEWLTFEPWENAGTKMGFIPISGVSVKARRDAPAEEIGEALKKAVRLCVPQYP
jgi:hypothetical protein